MRPAGAGVSIEAKDNAANDAVINQPNEMTGDRTV